MTMTTRAFLSVALALSATALISATAAARNDDQSSETEPSAELVLMSDVEWGPLNPARGDKGPRAGDLWGDRTGSGASGFLVKFDEGFSSPPHIHNITYRGVVITGLVHNDDPDAAQMWLPTASFWQQPAGEAHITAAQGSANMAYIEIDEGPYLVRPPEQAFDGGEKPVNVDQSNLVWIDGSSLVWVDQPGAPASDDGPKVAFLWGDPQGEKPRGTLVKLPNGFAGSLGSQDSTLRAVTIQGRIEYRKPDAAGVTRLAPGDYFGSTGQAVHQVACEAEQECILYVRANDKFEVN